MGSTVEAWQIRWQNFAPVLFISRPQNTESISVTGSFCALKCAHCGGHYLSKMTDLSSLKITEDIKGTSCLISGGCDLDGKVQIMTHVETLKKLKGKHRYNFHTGLLSEEEIKAIAPLADVVSFDFLGDAATIKDTLKLYKTVEDYAKCYSLLRKYCQHVAPHICIGLHGGEIRGEYEAVKALKKIGLEKLIFIVFIPTKGTEYADLKPPKLAEVIEFLSWARKELPTTPLIMGCMRPGGTYRTQLDEAAIECGINGIVQPVRSAVKKAEGLGLTMQENKECCAL